MKSIFIIMVIVNLSLAQETNQKPYLQWEVGEQLTYKVKWTFIKLGQIKITILNKTKMNHRSVYHCQINIDSSPSLPFVNIHDRYESHIDSSGFYSHLFQSYEKKEDFTVFTQYAYDPVKNKIDVHLEKHSEDTSVVLLDSIVVSPDKMFDSLSMFFLARALVKTSSTVNLSLFVYNKFETTDIDFTGDRDEIKHAGEKINCFYLEGKLKFVGIAGVKDDFRGWFSPDSQSVPIKASMKAFIGSVKIELQEWKNWENSIAYYN